LKAIPTSQKIFFSRYEEKIQFLVKYPKISDVIRLVREKNAFQVLNRPQPIREPDSEKIVRRFFVAQIIADLNMYDMWGSCDFFSNSLSLRKHPSLPLDNVVFV
jgi:hypothetical protein